MNWHCGFPYDLFEKKVMTYMQLGNYREIKFYKPNYVTVDYWIVT